MPTGEITAIQVLLILLLLLLHPSYLFLFFFRWEQSCKGIYFQSARALISCARNTHGHYICLILRMILWLDTFAGLLIHRKLLQFAWITILLVKRINLHIWIIFPNFFFSLGFLLCHDLLLRAWVCCMQVVVVVNNRRRINKTWWYSLSWYLLWFTCVWSADNLIIVILVLIWFNELLSVVIHNPVLMLLKKRNIINVLSKLALIILIMANRIHCKNIPERLFIAFLTRLLQWRIRLRNS